MLFKIFEASRKLPRSLANMRDNNSMAKQWKYLLKSKKVGEKKKDISVLNEKFAYKLVPNTLKTSPTASHIVIFNFER